MSLLFAGDRTHHQIARFVAVGVSNTAVSYGLFLILAIWIDERVAYSIAFLLGLIYTTVLSSRWVFRSQLKFGRSILFVSWYLLMWAIGLGIIQLVGRGGFVHHVVAAAAVLAVTTPLNFLGGSTILKHPSPPRPRNESLV